MSKPMTVARYAKEHRGWFYGCLLLFALVAFFCLKAIYDMTVYGAKAPLYALTAGMVGFGRLWDRCRAFIFINFPIKRKTGCSGVRPA